MFRISKFTRLNDNIRASQLRVIDQEGKQLGILSKAEALEIAQDRGLDLVEISPNADPPVAKVIDWGKFNYQRTKQQQKNKKSAKTPDLKQMRFGLKIGDHDLGVKTRKVTSFLEAGHKVRISIVYRGRELAHKDLGFKLAERIINQFGDSIVVEQSPQFAGRQLNFTIRSSPSAKPSQKKAGTDENANQDDAPSTKDMNKSEGLGG